MKPPREVLSVYDHPGFADRYTVVTVYRSQGYRVGLALSADADSPQGVRQWCEIAPGASLGSPIGWDDLPQGVRRVVVKALQEG